MYMYSTNNVYMICKVVYRYIRTHTQFIIVSKTGGINLLVPYISKIYVLPGHFTDWFLKLKDL